MYILQAKTMPEQKKNLTITRLAQPKNDRDKEMDGIKTRTTKKTDWFEN